MLFLNIKSFLIFQSSSLNFSLETNLIITVPDEKFIGCKISPGSAASKEPIIDCYLPIISNEEFNFDLI